MKLVLVAYTASKTQAAIKFCEQAFRATEFSHRVLVCNRPGLADAVDSSGWTVLAGSNSFAEFSGWQEGLDHVSKQHSGGPVLFVNDTVNTHRLFSMFRRLSLVHELARAPSCSVVGFVDHAANDIGDLSIAGLPLCGWVSSYCFLLGEEGLARLQHRLYVPEVIDRCVLGGLVEDRFFSDSLSADLRKHLCAWLFGGGWYRSQPLSQANREMFTAKARVICAELHLSARCWNLGLARRDPFERHPWSGVADQKYEMLLRRIGRARDPS